MVGNLIGPWDRVGVWIGGGQVGGVKGTVAVAARKGGPVLAR